VKDAVFVHERRPPVQAAASSGECPAPRRTARDDPTEAETPMALKQQRPLPDDAFRIVANGETEDGPPALTA
jgi:hypothetical protein